ncbi:MAG: hypothetical protein MUE85_22965 [Microscillaceae bacterium]|jgi:hypothetical protein|nr:hypothetical protein [Microscillaceae bacterium]
MKYIWTSALFIIFTSFINLKAQNEDLTTHRAFFDEQLKNYSEWLKYSNLSDFISIKQLTVQAKKVTLSMNIKNKNHWIRLNKNIKETQGVELGSLLFEKFAFLSNLSNNLELYIYAKEEDVEIEIKVKDNSLKIEIFDLMGAISDTLPIPIKNIKGISSVDNQITTLEINIIKQKLIVELERLFRTIMYPKNWTAS